MTAWTSAAEVSKYAIVRWDALNYASGQPFANETAFNAFLADTLIPRAQAHINAHCKRDFDVDYPNGIPEAVKDVAARAAANMVQYLVMNKMGPLIRVDDYKITIPEQAVLTKELRELLLPWRKRTPHVTSTPYKTDLIHETWDED